MVMPVLFEDQVLGVIELASLRPFSEVNRDFLDQLTDTIGVVINTIRANMRTEELLTQSQGLTQELQKQSEELRSHQRRAPGEGVAAVRAEPRHRDQERGDRVRPARPGGEGGAAGAVVQVQVGVPGQHVARAAHAAELDADPEPSCWRPTRTQSLTDKQVEFAQHDPRRGQGPAVADQRHPGPVEGRGRPDGAVELSSDPAPGHRRGRRARVPPGGGAASGWTSPSSSARACRRRSCSDRQRIGQVLKNLLSNAFKFTHDGGVTLTIGYPEPDDRVRPPVAGQCRAGDALQRRRHRGRDPARTSSARSSRPSSRPTAPPAASTAAPALASRSHARSPGCSAARSTWSRPSTREAGSRCSCR